MNDFVIKVSLSVLILTLPIVSDATSLTGEWCENGGPYICYPPIDNKKSEFICIDGTTVTKATDDAIEFVTKQTIHYYSDGFKNGKTKPQFIKKIFKQTASSNDKVYELTETNRDEIIHRQLRVAKDTLQLSFSRKPTSSDKPPILGKINYQRCSNDTKKKSFYTALVDCGGSGDYITGVPAVVNNPLMWDLGEASAVDKSNCQVAAKCWGGGWVAFAKSDQQSETDKPAFGAACGTENRHEAKQQAINSCRESGGTNCLSQVVSGFDDGSNELDDSSHKGEYVESCSQGECAIISAR
ncbi:hypothetical protein [Kaarinaea lacus]